MYVGLSCPRRLFPTPTKYRQEGRSKVPRLVQIPRLEFQLPKVLFHCNRPCIGRDWMLTNKANFLSDDGCKEEGRSRGAHPSRCAVTLWKARADTKRSEQPKDRLRPRTLEKRERIRILAILSYPIALKDKDAPSLAVEHKLGSLLVHRALYLSLAPLSHLLSALSFASHVTT